MKALCVEGNDASERERGRATVCFLSLLLSLFLFEAFPLSLLLLWHLLEKRKRKHEKKQDGS